VPTGYLFNLLGNKGGVGIFLRLHDTPLAFVGAHLASGEGDAASAKRCTDFLEITTKVRFLLCALLFRS
jgi:hypothetical protein